MERQEAEQTADLIFQPTGEPPTDDELRGVLRACAGFRTFRQVQDKVRFLFTADDAIEYSPKAVKKVLAKNDDAGYAMLAAELPFTRINTGEYLGFSGKRRLLESHGVDVLNIHGSIGMSRAAAHLAGDFGIPVSLGNTILEIGVHLAASLPECLYLEFSDLAWNRLAKQPIRFESGFAIAPDRPGHGIEIDSDALEEFARPSG